MADAVAEVDVGAAEAALCSLRYRGRYRGRYRNNDIMQHEAQVLTGEIRHFRELASGAADGGCVIAEKM